MYIWYKLLTYLFYPFSPFFLFLRKLKKKEHPIRYKEKLSQINTPRGEGFLIWFHVASVGEALSILPLIENFEQDGKIKRILITSITVSSAEVLNPKYTIVKSLLLATDKKPAVKIDWRVYTKNPDKPLIRDLIIEGLSLARTQKEEFASVIESNNGDITKLFIALKEFVKK